MNRRLIIRGAGVLLLAAALSVSAQQSQEEVQRLAERTKGASDDWLLGRDLWNEPFQPYR